VPLGGTLTRRGLLLRLLGGLVAGVVARPQASRAAGLSVSGISVRNGGTPFAGDHRLLATISPRSVGGRSSAFFAADAETPLDAVLEVVTRNRVGSQVLSREPVSLAPGRNDIPWQPSPRTEPGSYVLRLRQSDTAGQPVGDALASVVVRVLDVEAVFTRRGAVVGEEVGLRVRSDARWLRLTLIRCGSEGEPTYRNDEMKGVPVGQTVRLDLTGGGPDGIVVPVRLDVPESGLYAARLEGASGRLGFAPIVVRPAVPTARVAVVLPTTTWQAYNFTDADGDGYGDTWYSLWKQRQIDLGRPHLRRGAPYRYRSYDLQFQHWLNSRGHRCDFYADEDVEGVPAETLKEAYDLIVFPGHTEYTTTALYDVIQRYRDLGGRLLFLSANNFFRRVERAGDELSLIDEWRSLARPEAALLGSQYLANDDGKHQQPFTVVGADAAPWAFAGTGLANGSQFGLYGIEIDARAPESPPETIVLANIPDLMGAGRTAEMTYYEAASGARVFSAGALNFGGTIMLWPETARLLDNVWTRLTSDVVTELS
jgi:hypothetical protein